MYKIQNDLQTVSKIKDVKFKDLNIKEREHLQEWIVQNPEMLGDDYLIIQKEFDGFNDTSERLDLLALDKSGNLVIIENKLDDSGRNVVWQALKYTSYCSTLSTKQVIQVFQDYLDNFESGEQSAKEKILDFMDIEDDELVLNTGDQKIIFVANDYRKEVTSTVLWLLKHKIDIRCVRAIPYKSKDDIFLQIEQIIPLPETQQYVIDITEKEQEEQEKSSAVREREELLLEFWTELKKELENRGLNYLERIKANHYFSIGFQKGSGKYAFCLGRKSYRVELYFSNDPGNKNFTAMKAFEREIESNLSENAPKGQLVWQGLEGKKATRIKFELLKTPENANSHRFRKKETWPQLTSWFAEAMDAFYKSTIDYWERVQNEDI